MRRASDGPNRNTTNLYRSVATPIKLPTDLGPHIPNGDGDIRRTSLLGFHAIRPRGRIRTTTSVAGPRPTGIRRPSRTDIWQPDGLPAASPGFRGLRGGGPLQYLLPNDRCTGEPIHGDPASFLLRPLRADETGRYYGGMPPDIYQILRTLGNQAKGGEGRCGSPPGLSRPYGILCMSGKRDVPRKLST